MTKHTAVTNKIISSKFIPGENNIKEKGTWKTPGIEVDGIRLDYYCIPNRIERGNEVMKLLSFAPELLEAVKKAYAMTAPLSTYGRGLEKLIAKAKGRA